jgi:F0F1-type ATP synthase assembly protein I
MSGAWQVSSIGFTLVICSVIGCGIGYWVDNRWHTSPWGIAIGFLFGTAAGFVEMFHILKKANKDG